MFWKKLKKIAAELATAKASEKKVEARKAAGGKQSAYADSDQKQILEILQGIAKEGREQELKRAAAIKADDKGDGDIKPGFSFPKEDAIISKWDAWQKRYEDQSKDVKRLFQDHFEETNKRVKEENAQDTLAAL